MMSAKTAFSETPAANTAPVQSGNVAANPANNPTAPGAAGVAPLDFQNLLAVVAPPLAEPSLAEVLPGQPLAQVFAVKSQPAQAKAPAAAATPLPADVSPGDLLSSLKDAATLLPAPADSGGDVSALIPQESIKTDDPKDDDILSDWLEVMLPPGVFTPQAGTNNPGEVLQGQGVDADAQGAQPCIPTSLLRQALVPGDLTPVDVAPPAAGGSGTGVALNRELLVAAANPVNALAAALTGKTETTEKDKPSADGWMSALGDLAAKRGSDAAPVTQPRLSTPVHDARWADALAHRLVLMARDGESTASLRLVPQDLGPLDIQISVRDGEASVHFGAAHQETRAVLEASMPRLRELLSAQGLQLGNASVSHQTPGKGSPERGSGVRAVGAATEETEVGSAQVVSTSLLDTYA